MKKVLRYLAMSVLAAATMLPMTTVDAATVAVLPLIDKTAVEGTNEVFCDNYFDVIKDQDKYELVDSEAFNKAVEKHTVKNELPSQEALKKISEEANVDLVIAIELDELSSDRAPSQKEDYQKLNLKGMTVYYDAETGKFTKHKIWDETVVDEMSIVRENFPLRSWARNVRLEMRRALKIKGFKVQKQVLQRF